MGCAMREEEENNEPTRWIILDTFRNRPYLGHKSFINKKMALRVLDELLKYHRDTDWATRLRVVSGDKLQPKNLRKENDGRRNNNRPKGCSGNGKARRPRATGVEPGVRMRIGYS
jgi:hypothetical protein